MKALNAVRASAIRRQQPARAAGRTELERKRGVYLATVAHEMRNALAPLSIALDLLVARQPGVPAAAELAPVARRQIRQLTVMVDDLLDLGRSANGAFRLRLAEEPLMDVVNGVVAAWRVLAAVRNQTIDLDAAPGPMAVRADRVRLAQVLQNVIGNAVKYSPEGGLVSVRVRKTGAGVAISVSDSGVGMDKSEIGRIFELFHQVRRNGQDSGGFGIGLALSRRLLELHGGTIRAASEGLGRGSTFTIALPLAGARAGS